MDYPKTVVASPEERESVVDRLPFDFPIVVKPENSNALDYLRCHFEGQKKVFFFDTREQYLTMVHSMNQSDYRGKLILQEFIPGGDNAMRVLNSYSDLDGHVRAMCLGQPVLEYYDPKSVGNYAAIISRGDQALYDKMQEFLEKLGYVGFSNPRHEVRFPHGPLRALRDQPAPWPQQLFLPCRGAEHDEAPD